MTRKVKAVFFDWGDTLMRDFPEFEGPMTYWERVEIIPGIKKALEVISPHYICCVASNAGDSNAEIMELALNRVNIDKYFKHFFTSRELGVSKPNPDFFNQLVNKLKLRPDECIFVGNDYEKDIVPAKAVGLYTVWFSEKGMSGTFTDADYSIHSMNKLYEVIMNLNSTDKANFIKF